MQDTRHTKESDKTTETNFDSFHNTQKEFVREVQHGKTGFARLVDCELVGKSEVPEEYENNYNGLSEKYLIFTAVLGKTDKEVKVVCSAKEDGINLNTALDIAGASSIDDLSGRKVPVQHVDNDVYRVAIFKGAEGSNVDLGGLPMTGVKFMLDNNLLEFKNGQWKESGLINPLFAVSMLMIMPTFAIGAISIFLGGSVGAFIFIGGLSLYIYLAEKYGR
jgi:hypothetical protein